MIIINLKNYEDVQNSVKLVKKIEKYLPNAIVCVSALALYEVKKNTKLKLWTQHISCEKDPRSTGFVLMKDAKKAGADGTLINHSEHKISIKKISETLKLAKNEKLKTVVCVGDLKMAKEIIKLKDKPWGIAFEDSKLISTGKSITEYNPDAIIKFVELMNSKAREIKKICGAGISNERDVSSAKKLGCDGVLIASAIANSKNPQVLLKKISEETQ